VVQPTICSLFEPHHKQNLYTNPKRTAKSLFASIIDTPTPPLVQNVFLVFFQGVFPSREEKQTPAPAFGGNWRTQILAFAGRRVKSKLRN